MKKIVSFILLAILILSISGCGTSSEKTDNVIDIDMTVLSSTMMYSEVEHLLLSPDDFVGKTIKMSGIFISSASQYSTGMPTDQIYYACMIMDNTACCQRFVEFVPASSVRVMPNVGDEITITGELQLYYNGQEKYCHLINAEFSN